jgi:hypothetical protein
MTDAELDARLRDLGIYSASTDADRIEALTKERRESALRELAALGQAADAYDAQVQAEAKLAEVQLIAGVALHTQKQLEADLTAATARADAAEAALAKAEADALRRAAAEIKRWWDSNRDFRVPDELILALIPKEGA